MTHLFPKNEHTIERVARFAIGLALLSLSIWRPHTLWGLIGLVPLATGLIGTCPIYTLVGASTRTAKQTQ